MPTCQLVYRSVAYQTIARLILSVRTAYDSESEFQLLSILCQVEQNFLSGPLLSFPSWSESVSQTEASRQELCQQSLGTLLILQKNLL